MCMNLYECHVNLVPNVATFTKNDFLTAGPGEGRKNVELFPTIEFQSP